MTLSKIDVLEEKASLLAPYIMQRVTEGAEYTEIASELKISRRMLYKYRQTETFKTFTSKLIDDQLRDIHHTRTSGDTPTALKYREGLLRIMTPQQREHNTIIYKRRHTYINQQEEG